MMPVTLWVAVPPQDLGPGLPSLDVKKAQMELGLWSTGRWHQGAQEGLRRMDFSALPHQQRRQA